MKHFLLVLLASLIFFPFSAGAQISSQDVRQAEAYLQRLDTAEADFIQNSSNGARLSGKFYLDRPGKLRFNYNEVKDFVVADGVFIYFYDAQLGEQSNAPIGQTLADFLLRKDLRLTGDLSVKSVYKKDGNTYITVTQSNDSAAGEVELVFTDVPYGLRGWRVTDAQGTTTDITLKNLQLGVRLDSSLFAYRDPKGRKAVND